VRDDVVQLPRDPGAFLGDRGARLFLPIQLQLVGSLLLPVGPQPPAVQVAAQQPDPRKQRPFAGDLAQGSFAGG
jgi:hypothetical protein